MTFDGPDWEGTRPPLECAESFDDLIAEIRRRAAADRPEGAETMTATLALLVIESLVDEVERVGGSKAVRRIGDEIAWKIREHNG